ncbi:MAG TPA: DUF6318 family protein, partial [Mycobacterium sp.]|nr:DUF6318 family protein [Mycobacterium sp.]
MRGRTRAPATGAAIITLTLALTGCGGGGEESTTATAPSSAATTPVAAAETSAAAERVSLPPLEPEEPPTPPTEMAAHDETGATAFVTYAVEVLNYTKNENDTELLRQISDPDCGFCNDMISGFDYMRENGIRRIGDELSFTAEFVTFRESDSLFFIDGTSTTTDSTDYDPDGNVLDSL